MSRARLSFVILVGCLATLLALSVACDRPQPTATPMPPPPTAPRVIRRVPERGQEQAVTAAISITFDQPMDRGSVEAAFGISPAVPGSLSWEGNTLLFVPGAEGLARGTAYRVTLDPSARSAAGLALVDAYTFGFSTAGYLEITYVQPAPGTEDVAPDQQITVMFSRPVVPLTAISSQAGLPQPLEFGPAAAGEGRWLNTSVYTFKATPGFLPGTTYKALLVAARLAEISPDVVLTGTYTWEFAVKRPDALAVTTSDPAAYIGPSPTISLTFNMEMDRASVEERLAVVAERSGERVSGTLSWQGETVGFSPRAPLALDAPYRLTLRPGARASIGGEGMAQEFEWSFRTIEAPRITETAPADGASDVERYTSVQVTFSSPIHRDSLLPNLSILPQPTEVYTGWNETDTQVYISFGVKPSTEYTFTFGADIEGRYGQKLGQPYRLRFTTAPIAPLVYVGLDRIGTYSAYTTTALYVQHVNVPSVNVALYRLGRPDFVLLNGGQWWERWDKFRPPSSSLVRRWTARVESPLDAYVATSLPLADDGESALPPGLYYVEVGAPGVREAVRHMLVVSRANVALKVAPQEALVWVTDLASGQPLGGLDVALFGSSGQVLATGRTDRGGVLRAELDPLTKEDPWASVLALVGSQDDPAAASTDWSNGIAPWQFGLPGDPSVEPYRVYAYTDRAIYRPGQTVFFKAIVRGDDDGRYSLPQDLRSMPVVVTDDQGKEIYRSDLRLNDMGTLHGEFDLSEEAGLGFYYLSTQIGERSYGTGFQVAEYRKPEFAVAVSTDRDEYTQGDTISVTVAATYYFGGPVADAGVVWRLMSQNYYFNWRGRKQYDFQDVEYDARGEQTFYGELVTAGEGKTDAEGRLTLQLPADVKGRTNSQLFTVEASITDPSNQEVSGRVSAVVHKGLIYVGLAPQEYLGTVGEESRVDVITVDAQSATVPNVPVTVVFLEQKWYNVQEEASDGRFYWQWKLEETPVYTTSVTTSGVGTAVAAFTPPKGGSYRARAFARDSRENEVRSSTYLWVSSEAFIPWRQENNDRIELVADKKDYRPGETARVLVPSPFQGPVRALLTVERGQILSHHLLTLESNSEQVEVPILATYAPNVYVSVVIVKGTDRTNPVSAYRVGYVNLQISTAEKELKVQITPDKTAPYRPSTKASFDVQVSDHLGHGVRAELSLQLVDLAVLALTDSRQGTLLDNFYRQRSLSVRTGATLAISVDRYREQAQPPSGKGGDGGRLDADVVRKRFVDLAYWQADVRTDAQGRARVTVDLPDNLTTWRMTGKAITAETLVGEGSVDIMTNKELLIRSVAPRFFVLGDQATLGAVVHNSTGRPLSVDVSLSGSGVSVQNSAQRVEVPAGGAATVEWPTQVTTPGAVVLTWRASSGDLSDALELSLPVHHFSSPEVVATAGQVPSAETRVETVYLPDRLDPSMGELTLQLEPSLAAGLRDGLKYLETYPYECIEQTVSRFLPNVATYRALDKLGIADPELEARLPQFVGVGLQRIYSFQHYDGGWGWWLADESNPFLSAYVLLGMNEAARAGFAVDQTVMQRAADYLRVVLGSSDERYLSDANARAFVLYALAEYGEGDLGRSVALYEKRDSLDAYGKAFLLLTLHTLQPEGATQVKTLLSDLANRAILSATGAHWEEEQPGYWTMNTDLRSTAIVLRALLRAEPQNGLIPNVVRWLMAARKGGHWETTQETAWSIMALTDFMVASGELEADYDYQVTLNAAPLDQGTVTVQDVNEARKLVVAVSELLQDESNRIVLQRLAPGPQQTGKGQLYYSLYLRYYLPAEDVVALNRGIAVQRQYDLLEAPGQPVDGARVGDVIRVKLTIIAPNNLHYLVVEDPLPAGCEALDTSLKTTSSAYGGPELEPQEDRVPYWWYFSASDLRDEKAVLFATYLAKGTYEYTYLIRASVPGRFLIMPASAYEMYFPEVFGRSDGGVFTVQE